MQLGGHGVKEYRGPRGLAFVRGVEYRDPLLRACRRWQRQSESGKGHADRRHHGGSSCGGKRNLCHGSGELV